MNGKKELSTTAVMVFCVTCMIIGIILVVVSENRIVETLGKLMFAVPFCQIWAYLVNIRKRKQNTYGMSEQSINSVSRQDLAPAYEESGLVNRCSTSENDSDFINPEKKMSKAERDRIAHAFVRIIALSKDLNQICDEWFYRIGEPVSEEYLEAAELKYGIHFPESYKVLLTISNGFCVDFCSTVGYIWIEAVKDETFIHLNKENSNKGINTMIGFGCVKHHGLDFKSLTGELFIEQGSSRYEPIHDFCEEVLEPVILYLEKQLSLARRKDALLEQQTDNPYRGYYDKLVSYKESTRQYGLYTNITLNPPVTEAEIASFEREKGYRLPEQYRYWLKLSNGSSFNSVDLYGLDEIFTSIVKYEEDDPEEEYVFLATLDGSGNSLLCNPRTSEMSILDEDFGWEKIDDMDGIFEDAFEIIEEDLTSAKEKES